MRYRDAVFIMFLINEIVIDNGSYIVTLFYAYIFLLLFYKFVTYILYYNNNDYNNNENRVNNTNICANINVFIKYVYRKYNIQRRKSPELSTWRKIYIIINIITLSCICHHFIVIVLLWELKQKIYDRNLISFNQQIKYRYISICKLKIMQLNWLHFLNIKNG